MSFRQYQYDQFVEGLVPPSAPAPPADGWVQPTVQPLPNWIKKATGYAVALIVSGAIWSSFTPAAAAVTTVISPCAEYPSVYYAKKYLTEALEVSDGQCPLGTLPEGTNPAVWIQQQQPQQFPTKPYLRTAGQQVVFWSTFTPPAAVTTVYPPCAEVPPSFFTKKYLTEAVDTTDGQCASGNFTPPDVDAGGGGSPPALLAFTLPCSYAAQAQACFWSTFTPSAAVLTDNWLPVYPDKVYGKQYLTTANQLFSTEPLSEQPEVVESSSWYPVYPQPYPTKPYLGTANQQAEYFVGQPEIILVSSWIGSQQQPIIARRLQQQDALSFVPDQGLASSVLPDKYVSRQNRSVFEPASVLPIFTQPTLFENWLPVYPDRVNAKTSLLTAQQQAFFYDPSYVPETVFVSSFVQPQSQPYPAKQYLTTANQQFSRAFVQRCFSTSWLPPTWST